MFARALHAARTHQVIFGVGLIFALTWPVDLAMSAQSRGQLPFPFPEWLALTVGYGFVVAAVSATALTGGWSQVGLLLRRYLIWRVGIVWYGVVLLAPVGVSLLALAIDVLLGGPKPDFANPFVRSFVSPSLSLWIVVPGWLAYEVLTNGEEIGWRGYVLPRLLVRHSAVVASLILGPVWAIWHIPKFLMAGTIGSAHAYPFWVFTLKAIAFSVLLTWVYEHTRGSLLLATLFHAASNTAFMALPITAGSRPFLIMVGLNCLLALLVVLATGPTLNRHPIVSSAAQSWPVSVRNRLLKNH